MCPVHVSNNFLDQTLFGSNVYREDAAADFLVKSYNNKNTNKRNTANFLPYLAALKNMENISSLCVPNDFPSLCLSCPSFSCHSFRFILFISLHIDNSPFSFYISQLSKSLLLSTFT